MSYVTTVQRSTTAAADGTASVTFVGPGQAWEVLVIHSIQLAGDSADLPVAKVYRGRDVATGLLIATELDGNAGGFDGGPGDVLDTSDVLVVGWEGCTSGAAMSAHLVGTVTRK